MAHVFFGGIVFFFATGSKLYSADPLRAPFFSISRWPRVITSDAEAGNVFGWVLKQGAACLS